MGSFWRNLLEAKIKLWLKEDERNTSFFTKFFAKIKTNGAWLSKENET